MLADLYDFNSSTVDWQILYQRKIILSNSGESVVLKDRNGMLVRVPESKLGEWSKQQEGEAKAPAEDEKERIRQEIYQKLGLK